MSKNGWMSCEQCSRMPCSAASHLGLNCLLRPVCPNTYSKYGIHVQKALLFQPQHLPHSETYAWFGKLNYNNYVVVYTQSPVARAVLPVDRHSGSVISVRFVTGRLWVRSPADILKALKMVLGALPVCAQH